MTAASVLLLGFVTSVLLLVRSASAGCFVMRTCKDGMISVGLFMRYTADKLVARDAGRAGNSTMMPFQRMEFGLDE